MSLYVPPAVGLQLLPEIAALQPREIWLNPGTFTPELLEAAATLKLSVIPGCSIIALGLSPEDFPDD